MAIFFTSDTHFGHHNIIKYCRRPFQTWWEMDKVIIENWNSIVGKNDEVYHLGDFALYGKKHGYAINTAEQLNGKIYLIRGNHDWRHFPREDDPAYNDPQHARLRARFEWIKDYHEIRIRDEEMGVKQNIMLFHYPIAAWNKAHHGSWQLHGHSHGTYPESDTAARIDVGMDSFSFIPMSYQDVKFAMTRKVFKPVDHHGQGH